MTVLTVEEFPHFYILMRTFGPPKYRNTTPTHTLCGWPLTHLNTLAVTETHTHTHSHIHTHVLWFLCYAEGFQGKFLWTWNSRKIQTVSEEKHSTFHENQHNGKTPLSCRALWLPTTSCPVGYHIPLHITWRRAGVHERTFTHMYTHIAVQGSPCAPGPDTSELS